MSNGSTILTAAGTAIGAAKKELRTEIGSLERQMLQAVEPIIEDIVAAERRSDRIEKSLADMRAHADTALTTVETKVAAMRAETETKTLAAVDALRAGDIAELRLKHLEAVEFVQRSFDDLVARIDEAVKASNTAVDTAALTARATVAPHVDELRQDFAEAITGVKNLLSDQLLTITTAAREFDERLKFNERRAADHLVMAASVFGA